MPAPYLFLSGVKKNIKKRKFEKKNIKIVR